jgi:hypothetical protein
MATDRWISCPLSSILTTCDKKAVLFESASDTGRFTARRARCLTRSHRGPGPLNLVRAAETGDVEVKPETVRRA